MPSLRKLIVTNPINHIFLILRSATLILESHQFKKVTAVANMPVGSFNVVVRFMFGYYFSNTFLLCQLLQLIVNDAVLITCLDIIMHTTHCINTTYHAFQFNYTCLQHMLEEKYKKLLVLSLITFYIQRILNCTSNAY